jgi:hypothetical protein
MFRFGGLSLPVSALATLFLSDAKGLKIRSSLESSTAPKVPQSAADSTDLWYVKPPAIVASLALLVL